MTTWNIAEDFRKRERETRLIPTSHLIHLIQEHPLDPKPHYPNLADNHLHQRGEQYHKMMMQQMSNVNFFLQAPAKAWNRWCQGAASGGLLGPPWPLLRRWPGRLQAPTRGWAEAWQEPKPHAVVGCWMILDLDLGDCHAGKSMYKWLWVRVQYGAIVISDRWGWGSDRLRKGEMYWDSCVHLMPWDFCGNFSLAIQDLHVCGNGIHNSWILQISWRALSQARPQVRWHPKRTGCHLQGVKMCEDVWRCVKMFGALWRCLRICEDVWRCLRICEDVWRCVKMFEDLWRCVKMCEDMCWDWDLFLLQVSCLFVFVLDTSCE